MTRKKMSLVVLSLLLVLASVLWGQTVVSGAKLMFWTGSGVMFAPLPAGWSLSLDATGKPTLTTPGGHDDWRQLTADQAAFTAACTPVGLHVYRNGLRQHAAFDFDQAGAAATFRAGAVPVAGDTVELEYGCQ